LTGDIGQMFGPVLFGPKGRSSRHPLDGLLDLSLKQGFWDGAA
jgi:hypothetical protein